MFIFYFSDRIVIVVFKTIFATRIDWRDNYIPDVSAFEQDVIEVDSETKDMLKMIDFQSIPGPKLSSSRGAGANFLT